MNVRPLSDRLLVKRVVSDSKTAGGLYIPENAKEKPSEGTVISVGSGKVLSDGKIRTPEVRAGDTVLFSKFSGTEIKVDGIEHVILREDDVLGIIG